MNKLVLLMLALMLACGSALGEAGLANPWTQTTAQGLMDALGLQLGIPDGATNVRWQMLESEQRGEVRFTWQDVDYVARIAPTEEFEDISGMYYDWLDEETCTVGRCDGVSRRGRNGESDVALCLWFDSLTGLMYSVGVVEPDLDGFDILAAASILYIPMQTE